jgi:nicotinamide riboside kinase
MKIALSGAHGTGKTTIFNMLKELFPAYEFIEEIVRTMCKKKGITHSTQIDKKLQTEIHKQYCEILLAEDNFISDRAISDTLSYMELYHGLESKKAENISKELMKEYDLILYFPIEFAISDDGFRFTGKESQRSMDFLVKKHCKFARNVVTVCGTIEERFEITRQAVSKLTRQE